MSDEQAGRVHGAHTIQAWLDDLAQVIRSGEDYQTSAGAEPDRSYAYLEFHSRDGERHALLLFTVQGNVGAPLIVVRRFDGSGPSVQASLLDLKRSAPQDGVPAPPAPAAPAHREGRGRPGRC